jgi:hypothetical protein
VVAPLVAPLVAPTSPESPVLPVVTVCCVIVVPSTVPTSLPPIVTVVTGSGGACDTTSLPLPEVIVFWPAELSVYANQPSPASLMFAELDASAGVAGALGSAAAAGAGAFVPGVAAGAAGVTGLLGSATGVPMSSLTTAALANGSFGAAADPVGAAGPIWACVSLTTGRCRRITCRPTVVGVVAGRLAGRVCGSAGSGASRCTFGIRKSGTPRLGSERAGSGVERAGSDGWRNAAATGPTYMNTSTVRPIPAHQYRIPLNLNAVSPNGCSAATAAYEPVAAPL